MAQCRSSSKAKESLRARTTSCANKEDSGCDTCPEENLTDTHLPEGNREADLTDNNLLRGLNKQRVNSLINLRSSSRNRTEPVPDVGRTGSSPTTHSNMKTKQAKEESDKSIDEDTVIEPKTRARKKASGINEEEKTKPSQDDPKTSKETKKTVTKPKAVVKKRPLGIRKTLRSKKAVVTKDKIKSVIRQTVTRGRKAAIKPEPGNSQEKEAVLIPVSEIKKEPLDDTPNSRSSSPKTAGRRQRQTSDMMMMKSVLGDSPSSLVLGPRTSPYSMRSERSNSPLLSEGKNLRSGKPRKVKCNLLNEVVMKEQKKRRRLLSDSKATDATDASEECKKLKRGRSCSRDGSEISKCSDITESDLSLSEPLNDTDSKELNKKLDKSKTDLDIDIENIVQISTTEKVPSLTVDSVIAETKTDAEPSCIANDKNKKKLSLKRSTSLDSDNNNSNRLKLDNLNSSDIEEKLLMKTEHDTLFAARSSILTSMSKTFNSKEMSKNIRKARRGRKAASRPNPNLSVKGTMTEESASIVVDAATDDKQETLETLSKEIDDLINNLDQNIDRDHEIANTTDTMENNLDESQTKTVSKFHGLSKPLGDNNSIITPETPVKDKDSITSLSITNENTPSKNDDSENIRLHYDEDSVEKSTDTSKHGEITYKVNPVASIDKLMDRLKEFEEFDKRRQRQESESKSNDSKSVMVTNDVVLIQKSGTDIKHLKDIQCVRSPERPVEKENVLSCFENNSAISIVKRDHVRKSLDVDLPNSVTLIKRNSVSARKESTSSNHSKESDAISIFEKSLGKGVTLTEIRKSADKPHTAPTPQIELNQFATLHPNTTSQNLVGGVVLDSNQISITPRVVNEIKTNSNDVQIITKRKSRESLSSRKSSESAPESEEKMATLEKIKSPTHQMKSPTHHMKSPTQPMKSPAVSITPAPVAMKSEASAQPVETEALPPPIESIKAIPENISLATEIPVAEGTQIVDIQKSETELSSKVIEPVATTATEEKIEQPAVLTAVESLVEQKTPEKMLVDEQPENRAEVLKETVEVPLETKEKLTEENPKTAIEKVPKPKENKIEVHKPQVAKAVEVSKPIEVAKPVVRSLSRNSNKSRSSTECLAGPSNVLLETPESQKRKENILRTLGLLTHKAAKEAKIEKLKEKERIYKNKAAKSASGASVIPTGSLKAVIKLNRSSGDRDKKKYRSSLKMTFQKSKNRSGKTAPEGGEAADDDDTYYTIERREGGAGATTDGGHRKSHYSNRLNNHAEAEVAPEPAEPKETPNLVIPEKASSFSIHPGRLCQDQCFYCGGKFGLFDTPCHIAQMKSAERQKKVLDNEEKLTSDSCLCDACFRHVDRRANCPSYRKRPLVKQPTDTPMLSSSPLNVVSEQAGSAAEEEESSEDSGAAGVCHTEGCAAAADHSIRRKWLIKMRSSVSKVLKLKCDYPGLHTIPLCGEHHRLLAPLTACALCRRRITKHHNVHFIHHGYLELNPVLAAAGIPVSFLSRPLLCKLCRVYCTLLQRAGHDHPQTTGYRRKLLQIYNVEVPPEIENDPVDAILQEENIINNKQKKKQRTKSKQRKSLDPEKTGDSESSERTTPHDEGSPEKMKDESNDASKLTAPIEEDIESLISSNKIMVPTAKQPTEQNAQSDGSESEIFDMDTPLLPLDKQTELQYLLQKQNNPAQFLQKSNLTQKQRNIMKLQSMSGIQKPGQQHRINEKNAKRIHKIGQIVTHKDKGRKDEMEIFDPDKCKEGGIPIIKNMSLNDECTIETIPNKKPADINTLKNKWQMSESFTQVKKNLSELSKKLDKEPKKLTEKYSNPVKRLETNPSISVRELFPGEEEMNLQCNIEFSNVKGVTPEGWEKCNAMIQYDVETKKLWNELQRPYGNQSSFLRHLVLLEKYFRSGDLVLAHNASPHASTYSDSVQSRLRAYDNVPGDTPRRPDPPVSLIEYRKKPSMNGKSLLKSNQTAEGEKETKKFMPPPGALPKTKVSKSSDKSKSKALPPELIAINTTNNAQGRKAIQNVLHNIQQLVKGVSASDPTEVAAAPLPIPKFDAPPPPKFDPPPPKFDPPPPKFDPPPPKFDTPPHPPKEKKETSKADTPKKTKPTSKPWRPTLMPITAENLARIAREPTQVAVDGRTLPSLVQVMSSGKRYHITLQDYNKMCIMRREKLQQLQDGDARPKRLSTDETAVVTEVQTSAMLGNGGTVLQTIAAEDKQRDSEPDLAQIGSNAANILKNVGLKNITIAPIPPKTATITSATLPAPFVTSPSLLVKLPQLGPAVSITSEPLAVAPSLLPKIPRSLTVIPQAAASVPASAPAAAEASRP